MKHYKLKNIEYLYGTTNINGEENLLFSIEWQSDDNRVPESMRINDILVRIRSCPQISEDILHLRGENNNYNETLCRVPTEYISYDIPTILEIWDKKVTELIENNKGRNTILED